jgi:hypothetical protein
MASELALHGWWADILAFFRRETQVLPEQRRVLIERHQVHIPLRLVLPVLAHEVANLIDQLSPTTAQCGCDYPLAPSHRPRRW